MSHHTDQTLPCAPFFLAQGPAHIRKYNQRVRNATLTKLASAHKPASICREPKLDERLVITNERGVEVQLFRSFSEQLIRGMSQQFLSRRINKAQLGCRIKREDRNFHFFHDALQESRCLNNPGTMPGEQISQGVYFERELAQCIFGNREPRAE